MTNGESDSERRGFTDGYEADYISVQRVGETRLHVEHHRGPMQWLDRAAARTGLEHGEVRLAAG